MCNLLRQCIGAFESCWQQTGSALACGFRLGLLWGALLTGYAPTAFAQLEFEQAPINYGNAASDPVTQLQESIDAGQVSVDFDTDRGYLETVLKLLDIKPSSQVLVFSKTSFQLRRISPQKPRALYFNDESYIGWVQDGDVIEVMTTDPEQGATFYTLAQEESPRPRFLRDQGQCLTCHASSRTQGVPGGLVRSVFADAAGQPQFGSGTFTIDHRSPFEKRWGGWYVSGTHGEMRHMGNVLSKDRQDPELLDREMGANCTDLSSLLDVTPYVSAHSDIVALMVLEHQTQMQNYLTLASYQSQQAAHYDQIMNEALDRPADYVSDTTKHRIENSGDKLLRYLLFTEEFALTSPVEGTSAFAKEFEARGPFDRQGRSLRQFDLQTRLFKYPCSYMIYSRSFDQLPAMVKEYVLDRLHRVLSGEDDSEEFAHLTAADRQAILEILTETMPGIWQK